MPGLCHEMPVAPSIPFVTTKNVPDIVPCTGLGEKSPLAENLGENKKLNKDENHPGFQNQLSQVQGHLLLTQRAWGSSLCREGAAGPEHPQVAAYRGGHLWWSPGHKVPGDFPRTIKPQANAGVFLFPPGFLARPRCPQSRERSQPFGAPLPCSHPHWGAALPPRLTALSAPETIDTAAAQDGVHGPPDVAFLVACPHQALQSHSSFSAWWEAQAGLHPQDKAGPLAVLVAEEREGEAPSYPEADLPVGAHLQVEAVGAIPVAIDDVHFAVAVEVSQGDTSPMLVGVVHTWEERQDPQGSTPCSLHHHSPCGSSMKSNKAGSPPLSLALWGADEEMRLPSQNSP